MLWFDSDTRNSLILFTEDCDAIQFRSDYASCSLCVLKKYWKGCLPSCGCDLQ